MRWSNEEEIELLNLYQSGDKSLLPMHMVVQDLNEEFNNNRTEAACRQKLSKMAIASRQPPPCAEKVSEYEYRR